MLKRQSKVLSIALVFVFCMSFMFAGFAAPDVASASSTYDVIKTQSVSNVGDYLTTVKIQIDVPNVAALTDGDLVTVHLPADLIMENNASAAPAHAQAGCINPDVIFSSATGGADWCVDLTTKTPGAVATAGTPNIEVTAPTNVGSDPNAFDYATAAAPSFIAYPVGNSTIEIKVTNTADAAFVANEAGRLYVNLLSCKVDATFDGDITARFAAPDGSGFSSGTAVIAKYVGTGGGTFTTAKSVVTMGTAAKALDTIMIQETAKNTLKPGDEITLKLPKGFKWTTTNSITAAWGFANLNMGIAAGDCVIQTDERKMKITLPAAAVAAPPLLAWDGTTATTEGRLYFLGTIEVDDETEAKLGDVTVHVSGDNVTDQDIIVATYAEYGVTVAEKEIETVAAGRDDTELGSFVIKENMKDSIVPGRTVTLELPSGVEWDATVGTIPGTYTPSTCISTKVIKGADWFAAATASLNKNRNVLKYSLAAGAMGKSEIEIKDLKVAISPDFTGDIVVKIAGTAGIEGEVKVAEVVAPLTFADLDASAANIIIGKQGQRLPDVTLVEGKKEAVKATAGLNAIAIALPFGATFDSLPTVTVEDGDITIDRVSYMTGRTGVNITIKGTSDKAATIKLSDLVATLDRTVPEGEFKLSIDAAGSTALTNTAATFNVTYMGEQAIAKCVTPAPGEGTAGAAAGQFKIDSNIYEVNGVAKVMDAAPYIKADRTYVPVRYLAYALGVAEDDVVWDEASQKVTLTKGDNVVELNIGSTTITVNGEAQTMDVAPEITNGRTMLPARYVAEGLGYVVGWDPGTRTVLISK